jgi:hypothetical protein
MNVASDPWALTPFATPPEFAAAYELAQNVPAGFTPHDLDLGYSCACRKENCWSCRDAHNLACGQIHRITQALAANTVPEAAARAAVGLLNDRLIR